MNDTNLQSFPRPLAGLAAPGLVGAAGAGILGNMVAATLHTRARPGDLTLLSMDLLETVLPGEQLDVTGYRLEDTSLTAAAVITAILFLPLVLLYFRFALRPAWEEKAALAAKIAAGGTLAFIASLLVAAGDFQEQDAWLMSVIPHILAAVTCAASAAMSLLLLRQPTIRAVTPSWLLFLSAAVAGLVALAYLGVAVTSQDSDRENIFFTLPLMIGLYAIVSLSALVYRDERV